jgi:hypothetical protein
MSKAYGPYRGCSRAPNTPAATVTVMSPIALSRYGSAAGGVACLRLAHDRDGTGARGQAAAAFHGDSEFLGITPGQWHWQASAACTASGNFMRTLTRSLNRRLKSKTMQWHFSHDRSKKRVCVISGVTSTKDSKVCHGTDIASMECNLKSLFKLLQR